MRYIFSVLLVIYLASFTTINASQSESKPVETGVTGTWVPESNSGANYGWQQSGKQLKFLYGPELSYGPYKITRTEPLPDGDYTIDLWIETVSKYDTISLCIGDPKTSHNRPVISVAEFMNRGLPLRWVRMACKRDDDMFVLSVDGKSGLRSASDCGVRYDGQLTLVVQSGKYDAGSPEVLRVISCTVTPGVGADFGAPGPAFQGWSTKIKPISPEDIADFEPKMEALYATAKYDAGKSYTLAAMILAEYCSKGVLGGQVWKHVRDLVTDLLPRERSGLAIVLPIAAACGDANQRAQIKNWTAEFFAIKDYSQWQSMKVNSETEAKAMLLDPVLAGRMSQHVSYEDYKYLTTVLQKISPEFSSIPIMDCLAEEDWKPEVVAWMLPDVLAASPRFGKSAVDVVRKFAKQKTPMPGEPDKQLSFAAYRLAKVDPAMSDEFLSVIKDPEAKADTIYYIANALAGDGDTLTRQMVDTIEKLMRQSIADWKPTGLRSSPVSVMMRLVKFLDSQKQTQKANDLLAETITKIGVTTVDEARDTLEIARYKRQTKAADFQEWWDRAITTAQKADEERDGSDNVDAIYISGLSLMVRDLVKDNQIIEAVKLVKLMDPVKTQDNRAMALDSIILQVIKTDPNAAIQYLTDYPDTRAKYGITGTIAVKIAPNDLRKALDLLQTIPESFRTNALLRIAAFIPISKLSTVIEELKTAIAAGIKPTYDGSFTSGFGNGPANLYTSLPIETLLSLSDAFTKSPDLLAVYLLASIVKHCGLDTDPIWVQYWGTKRFDSKGNPWGVSKLRYAVVAE